jgi:hypothetical protein
MSKISKTYLSGKWAEFEMAHDDVINNFGLSRENIGKIYSQKATIERCLSLKAYYALNYPQGTTYKEDIESMNDDCILFDKSRLN